MNKNTCVRPWVESDAGAICRIYNHYVEATTATFELEPVKEPDMLRRLADFSRLIPPLVAVDGSGAVCGYAYIHTWKDKAAYAATAECTVYLVPDACGSGIGRPLMERLIADSRRAGIHTLVACITAENDGSRRFHERLGFRQVSEFAEVGRKFGRMLGVADYQLIL